MTRPTRPQEVLAADGEAFGDLDETGPGCFDDDGNSAVQTRVGGESVRTAQVPLIRFLLLPFLRAYTTVTSHVRTAPFSPIKTLSTHNSCSCHTPRCAPLHL